MLLGYSPYMGNPIDDAMRDFAVNELNKELNIEEDPEVIGVQIFGWNVWRVFRDEHKNMIKIVLRKGNRTMEFSKDD